MVSHPRMHKKDAEPLLFIWNPPRLRVPVSWILTQNIKYKVNTSAQHGASSLLNQEANILLEVEWFAGRLVSLERLPSSVKQNLKSSMFPTFM